MKVLVMLIRREFWEHRALVIAPLVVCVIYLILSGFAAANVHMKGLHIGDGGATAITAFSFAMHVMFTGLLYLLTAIVTFFYLSDSLYAERKERSILFWKSLPVSDALTVISKLLVALIMVPLVVYALSIATHVLVMLVFKVAGSVAPSGVTAPVWSWASWLKLNGYLIMDVFIFALWFAPVAAYVLLISVLVPRAPLVWTILPPLALILGQGWLLGNWSIGSYVGYRLGAISLGNPGRGVDAAVESINGLPVLSLPGLWIGVAVAVVLAYATIRIRRHRDDS